jgi:hypothetical protein
MSVTILIVEKTGVIKEHTVKNYSETELFRKAGFKSADGFACQTEWNIDNGENDKSYSISVYGKTTGRAGQENKYEFPPPIDNTLFFGNCVIVNKKSGQAISIMAKEWETVYEYLYGGFEDVENSEYDEDSEEEVDETQLTKNGYLKDDFVVDDDEDEDNDENNEDEEDDADEEEDKTDEEDDEPFVSKKKVLNKKSVVAKKPVTKVAASAATTTSKIASNSKKGKKTAAIAPLNIEASNYFECASVLSEEDYV